jgi:hypothetical protein
MARAFDVYVGGDVYDAPEKVFTPVVDGADFLAIPRVDGEFATRDWLTGEVSAELTGQPAYEPNHALLQNGAHYLQTTLDDLEESTVITVCRRSVTTNTASQHTGFYGHLTAPTVLDAGVGLAGPTLRTFDLTSVRAQVYFGTPGAPVLDQRGLTLNYAQWRLFVHRVGTGRHRLDEHVSGLSSSSTPSGAHVRVTSKASIGRGFGPGETAGSAWTAWWMRYPRWLTDAEARAQAGQIVAELTVRGLALTLA